MSAKFSNTGESCIGANRVLVQAGVYDALRIYPATIVEVMADMKKSSS